MISALRADYVNTWMLAKELDAIAERSGDPDIARLCALIQANYGYPVDSVLIAPDLRVVGHVNAHEPRAAHARSYLGFLREGLARARGEEFKEAPAEEHASEHDPSFLATVVKLTPDEPTGTVLDVIRRGGFAEHGMSFFSIDATGFTGAGELEIHVRVGSGKASGTFELCAAPDGDPSFMGPVRTLAKLGRGESGTMVHAFEKGAHFGLAAKAGPGSTEGELNAFLATITARPR